MREYFKYLLLFLAGISYIYRIKCYNFKDMDYNTINQLLLQLNGSYAMVQSVHDMLGVDVSSHKDLQCSPTIIRISHMESLPKDFTRPQLLISGEIHGDERVGPIVSLFLAQILVWSAKCEVSKELEYCLMVFEQNKFTIKQVRWLTSLVMQRDIFIIPTANCLGFIENKRIDGIIDPNRDFPYGRKSSNCMLSNTAKIFDKLMKTTLTQIVITFHGGMVALGYEWGSINHLSPNDRSPDDNCNKQIGNVLKQYASTFPGEKAYPVGRINSLIYPVEGGMEDWLYAAGWDKDNLKLCKITAKEDILSSNNRAIVYLVETSDMKRPTDSSLGSSEMALQLGAPGDGHIPRNIRLSLASIDLIQPYICLLSIYMNSKKDILSITYRSGGAITINQTFVALHRIPNHIVYEPYNRYDYLQSIDLNPADFISDTEKIPRDSIKSNNNTKDSYFLGKIAQLCNDNYNISKENCIRPIQKGPSNLNNPVDSIDNILNLPHHQVDISIGSYFKSQYMSIKPGKYYIILWSSFDLNWKNSGQGEPKNLSPQSHLSNARTNVDWHESIPSSMHSTIRKINGRIYWPSDPIAIELFSDGTVTILSYTLECLSWNRTELSNTYQPNDGKDTLMMSNTSYNSVDGSYSLDKDNMLRKKSRLRISTVETGNVDDRLDMLIPIHVAIFSMLLSISIVYYYCYSTKKATSLLSR